MANSLGGKMVVDIEMLIGADYYWDLTIGPMSKRDSGLVAIQIKLGWVLSEPTQTVVRDHCPTSLMTWHNTDIATQNFPISYLDNFIQ